MSAQTDYISYLETKVCDQDFRIKEMEATLMMIVYNQANPVNQDLMYLQASKVVNDAYPFPHETIKRYKEILIDCQGKI